MRSLLLRVLGSTLLAALLAGCANTPRAMGIPWWPQGPGDAPEEARCAEAAPATPCPTADSSIPESS
jgi:hypothetical protein